MAAETGSPDPEVPEEVEFSPPAATEKTYVCRRLLARGASALSDVGRDPEDGSLVALCRDPAHAHDAKGITLTCWGHVQGLDPGLAVVRTQLVRAGAWFRRTAAGWTQVEPPAV